MDLSIIIVNYKTRDKTLACLGSIFNSNLDDFNYEVIVVDNYSQDDTHDMVPRKYPQVKFIQNLKNVGMGGANNIGIKEARGEYLLILNADTIVRPGTIQKLLNYIQVNPEVGIVAPRLLNTDNTHQYSCFRDYKFITPVLRRTFLGKFFQQQLDEFLMKDVNFDTLLEVDWVMGSSLMTRAELLRQHGAFDERFFMYFEDTDLCRRLRRAGFKIIYYPLAEVIHDHGRASAKGNIFFNKYTREHVKSWLRYFYKWK